MAMASCALQAEPTSKAFQCGAGQAHGCTAVAADVGFPGALEAFGLPGVLRQWCCHHWRLRFRRRLRESGRQRLRRASVHPPLRDEHGRPRESYQLFNLGELSVQQDARPHGAPLLGYGLGDAAPGWAADTHVDLWKGSMGSSWLEKRGGGHRSPALRRRAHLHILRQLAVATGRPPLPPLWSLGYHRNHYWNIKSRKQLAALDVNFDRHGVPLDAAWLDDEHTLRQALFHLGSGDVSSPGALDAQPTPKGASDGRELPTRTCEPIVTTPSTRRRAHGWLVRHGNGTFVGKCWRMTRHLSGSLPAQDARAFWTSLYANGPSVPSEVRGQSRQGPQQGPGKDGHGE